MDAPQNHAASPEEGLVALVIQVFDLLSARIGPVWTSALLGAIALGAVLYGLRFAAPRSREHYLAVAKALLRGDVAGAVRAWMRAEGVKHSSDDPADLLAVAADLLEKTEDPKDLHLSRDARVVAAAARGLTEPRAKR
jgi:hypothetical protein